MEVILFAYYDEKKGFHSNASNIFIYAVNYAMHNRENIFVENFRHLWFDNVDVVIINLMCRLTSLLKTKKVPTL